MNLEYISPMIVEEPEPNIIDIVTSKETWEEYFAAHRFETGFFIVFGTVLGIFLLYKLLWYIEKIYININKKDKEKK